MKSVFWRIAALLLLMPLWAQAELSVHFLDVGQGDAALVVCDGYAMLIDGGSPSDSSFIYSLLSQTEQLEYIVATHPHDDHIGGIPAAFQACTVRALLTPVVSYDSGAFRAMQKYAQRQGTQIVVPAPGDTFWLGSAQIECLSPGKAYGDVNDLSIVVRIVYGRTALLFMGDATAEAEIDLVASGAELAADVLKVGHHGSDTSTTTALLEAAAPQYAIISCGADNAYAHPAEDTMRFLEYAGISTFRTDLDGTILCRSDGESVSILTEGEMAAAYAQRLREEEPAGEGVVVNRKSKKFHHPACSGVKQMAEKNRVSLRSREEALDAGYSPCGLCHP